MLTQFFLSGKTELITGPTGGIGFAIADLLAQTGADIVLHDIGETEQSQ